MDIEVEGRAKAALVREHELVRWDAEVENARRLAADRQRLNTLGTAAVPAAFYFAERVGGFRDQPWGLVPIGFGVVMTAFGLAPLNQSVSSEASRSRVSTASELLELSRARERGGETRLVDAFSVVELQTAIASQVAVAATVFLGINRRRAKANREGMNALSSGFSYMFGGLGLHWLMQSPLQW